MQGEEVGNKGDTVRYTTALPCTPSIWLPRAQTRKHSAA